MTDARLKMEAIFQFFACFLNQIKIYTPLSILSIEPYNSLRFLIK